MSLLIVFVRRESKQAGTCFVPFKVLYFLALFITFESPRLESLGSISETSERYPSLKLSLCFFFFRGGGVTPCELSKLLVTVPS